MYVLKLVILGEEIKCRSVLNMVLRRIGQKNLHMLLFVDVEASCNDICREQFAKAVYFLGNVDAEYNLEIIINPTPLRPLLPHNCSLLPILSALPPVAGQSLDVISPVCGGGVFPPLLLSALGPHFHLTSILAICHLLFRPHG